MSRTSGRRGLTAAWIILAMIALAGCATSNHGTGPYQTQAAAVRDGQKAHQLTAAAVEIMDADPARAAELLRQALTADLYHGPAHNNLGVLYLKQSPPKLYEAASEFEWARKLMPGHPDPRVNLALTLENAGRTTDALDTYETALEVYPNYLPAIQGLTRLQLRSGTTDDRTMRLLDDIALRGESESWRQWARRERLRLSPGSVQDDKSVAR